MKIWNRLFTGASLLALAMVFFTAVNRVDAESGDKKATEPLSEFELGTYQYCGSDSDCVKAVNGCCDCANGGADVAVNKERFDTFRALFDCLKVECEKKETTPGCGTGVVTCVNHKCGFVTPKELKEQMKK